MMRRWLDGAIRNVLLQIETLRRDLLTERHAAHRLQRYIPAGDVNGQPIIEMQAVEEREDLTGRGRPPRSAGPKDDDDMANNYYIIIHCAKCGMPIQAKRQGSKGRIIRICAACAAALRRRGRAA